MTERRVMSSEIARCPDCGNSEAIVRVRGNAFAATCTRCRTSTITPLLDAADLNAAMPDGPTVRPVSIMRGWERFAPGDVSGPAIAQAMVDDLPNHVQRMAVRFELPRP